MLLLSFALFPLSGCGGNSSTDSPQNRAEKIVIKTEDGVDTIRSIVMNADGTNQRPIPVGGVVNGVASYHYFGWHQNVWALTSAQ
ncbi:MAG: hypothetical protein H7145_24985 [Akkermansiaceae bacterium]|nr:hypothetical protein [Armatimonadota bacterium]